MSRIESHPQNPLPIRRIGPYRVVDRIGAGGAGEVWLGHDDRLDRRVAIKRIRLADSASDEQRQRFVREAKTVAQLSHPAVVRLFEVVSEPAGDSLVMEFVEGENLAQVIRRGALSPVRALRLGWEIVEALVEAHGKGIVHRDLKSENVMLTAHGHAKVLDFGLAKWSRSETEEASLTRDGVILGTLRSMSPEQANSMPVDERSDLFSLGVLFYEMLTGISPFKGTSALATLRQVVQHQPPPVRSLRPEVPPDLSALVSELLEKEPGDRPRAASDLLPRLRAMLNRAESLETALSQPADPFNLMETGSLELKAETPPEPRSPETQSPETLPPETLPPETLPLETQSAEPVRRRARLGFFLLVALISVAAALPWWLSRVPSAVRVAVPAPKVLATTPEHGLELVAEAVLDGALQTLIALDRVTPVDPRQIEPVAGKPLAIARAVAADEVLSIDLGAEVKDGAAEGLVRVSLRRIGSDGETLWTQSLWVPGLTADSRLTAEAVSAQLLEAYPRHALAGEKPRLEVANEDYIEFLRVRQRFDAGGGPLAAELDALERIHGSSPRFLTGWLLAAEIASLLASDTKNPVYLARAQEYLEEIRRLAPDDPRLFYWDFRLAMESGDLEGAERSLDVLRRKAPFDPDTSRSDAELAQRRGDLEAAIEAMRTVVAQRPSWRYLYRLATLELEAGDVVSARGHLEDLLSRAPGHTWGLGLLVQLEMFYGDLERAESLALELIEIKRHRSYFNNLGLIRYLLGRPADAKVSYLEAREIDPDHPAVLLNLADAESALGEHEAAAELYRQVLAGLDQRPAGEAPNAGELTLRAQCLARLGENRQAAEVVLEALRRFGEQADVAQTAALVYALIGDRASALAQVEAALERNIDRRWFEIPAFASLSDDPELRALLERSD